MLNVGTFKDPVMSKSVEALVDSYAGNLKGNLRELEHNYYKVIEMKPAHLSEEQRLEAKEKYIKVIEALSERIRVSG